MNERSRGGAPRPGRGNPKDGLGAARPRKSGRPEGPKGARGGPADTSGKSGPPRRGKGAPEDPSRRGKGAPEDPSRRGKGAPEDPSRRGKGAPDDPPRRGKGAPDDPPRRGKGAPDDPPRRGKAAPASAQRGAPPRRPQRDAPSGPAPGGRGGPGPAAARRDRDAPPEPIMVYGRNAVRELIRAGRRKVREIHATHRAMREPWLTGWTVTEAPPALLTELCGSPDHQGICAETDPYPYADAAALLQVERPLILALDEVTDPQNLGALARTAECAGATGLVIPERRSAEVTAAVCKASAGAVEHLPVARVPNLADHLAQAKVEGCWIYGADGTATAPYRQADYATGGVVLVLGAEGKGLRPRVAASCDLLVALPLQGRVESLNVAAAGAVLLYEILHQRLDKGP